MAKYFILIFILFTSLTAIANDNEVKDTSTKKERNFIKDGNELYRNERYAEAEVAYRKALEQNPSSEIASYNLASSLIKQSGNADPNNGKNPMNEASNLLKGLTTSNNVNIVENAYYDLGNMAFNNQQYQESIEMYKNALRRNPDNDKTRQNLRLAQLKLQEQQQNQDKNQDKNNQDQQKQDQNKDQNQDNKKQENKDQQDQNQNKDEKDKQDQDKNQSQNQDKQKQQPPQQSQGISDSNADKILKTMENEENATRRKVNARKKAEEAKAAGRPRGNQW